MAPPPLEIAFRPASPRSRGFLLIVIGFFVGAIGSLSQLPAARFLGGALALIVGLQVWRQRRIRPRPIRFDEAGVRLPGTLTRRVYTVPYHRIRSVWAAGKGRNARLIIDSDRRAFVYPLTPLTAATSATRWRRCSTACVISTSRSRSSSL